MDPLSFLTLGSTVFGAVGEAKSYSAQAGIGMQNAKIEEENAKLLADSGQADLADYGRKAGQGLSEIGAATAEAGEKRSSGSSGIRALLDRASLRQDLTRIAEDSRQGVRSAQNSAAGYRFEAKANKNAAFFSLASGALGVKKDLIDLGAKAKSVKATKIRQTT